MKITHCVKNGNPIPFNAIADKEKPILVIDIYSELRNSYSEHQQESLHLYHLQPGHLGTHGWDLLKDLSLAGKEAEWWADTVSTALLFKDNPLAHEMMKSVLLFAVQTGAFANFAEIGSLLSYADIRQLVYYWHQCYAKNSSVQHLMTIVHSLQEKELEATMKFFINRLAIFQSPLVASTFNRSDFSLWSLKENTTQIIFISPGIHDMMNSQLIFVYRFLFMALSLLAEKNNTPFSIAAAEKYVKDGTLNDLLQINQSAQIWAI